ncbi:MAG: hypothetical protein JRN06_07245 [Nitrososphaerota archaeon]|nr:hypothetical protein [Nitrososphaerota archaeon]MDG7024424.1 hypothetical protein [Nitrososphaerota archaeon]
MHSNPTRPPETRKFSKERSQNADVGSQEKPGPRERADRYTTAFVLALSGFVFLDAVHFLPGAPLLPVLVAAGLALASLSRPVWASGVLGLLAFLTILWQLLGFGLGGLLASTGGSIVAVLLVLFIAVDLAVARHQPVSMALALLAVSLMLTPYYYLSVAMIVIAGVMGGTRSIGPVASTFISALLPFILIENAIAYANVQLNVELPPVIFSQLQNVAQNQIPPLGSLNVFLTGLPAGAASSYSGAFVGFITGERASVIIVPLILLSIIFSSSASLAGATSALFAWLTKGRITRRLRAFIPLIAAVATPVAFVLLIVALSPASIGGYQTDLVSRPEDAGLLIGSSVLVGGAFTGRELLLQRLERLQRMKAELGTLLEAMEKQSEVLKGALEKVQTNAPKLDVGELAHRVQEVMSKSGDIRKGLETADVKQTGAWTDEIMNVTLPELQRMPEVLRVRMIEEANSLLALASIYNAMLEETLARGRFNERPEAMAGMDLDQAISAYLRVAARVKEDTEAIFKEYKDVTGAFNALMGREIIVPPVDPARVLETDDYHMAMKLVTQDYWTNFQAVRLPELEGALAALVKRMEKLSGSLDAEPRRRVGEAMELLSQTGISPALALERVEAVVSDLRDSAERIGEEVERLQNLAKSLSPEAARIVRFEILGQAAAVATVGRKAGGLKPSVEEVGEFAEEAALVFGAVEEARRKDARSMLILSQYPVASCLMDAALREGKGVRLADLPFIPEASVVFARLYTSGKRSLRYDDLNEEVERKRA